MLILLRVHFIEKTLRLREEDDLPRAIQPGGDGIRSHLAPNAAPFPLTPWPFSVLKEMEMVGVDSGSRE